MFRITRSAKLAVLAVVVAAATVMAGSASASAVIDLDVVPTIGTNSFSFNDGEVSWLLGDGTFTPALRGTLTLDNANGSCARMRMEYFHKGASIAVRYGGTVCAPNGNTHYYDVDLSPWSSPDIDLLKVSVEKQTAAGGSDFSIVESAYVSPGTTADNVEFTSKGVDFGGSQWSWATAEPTGPASLYWNRGDGAEITPRLMGYIWLNNAAGTCARMNLRYYTDSGALLAERHGGSGCAADDSLYAVSVDLQPYTSTQVYKVEVQLQTQKNNGSWDVIGSDIPTINR
jgi:hypothetical protein